MSPQSRKAGYPQNRIVGFLPSRVSARLAGRGAQVRQFAVGFSLPSSIIFRYPQCHAVAVVEGVPVRLIVTEVSTMLVIGIILSVFGIGFFCWLLFMLAVYALPFFVGMTAGLAAFHSGAGVIGALLVGVLAGGATLAIGQIAFATARSPLIRSIIALVYAVPAAVAGYHATLGLAQIGVPSEAWRELFAIVGAVLVGGTAWARMSVFIPPVAGQRSAANTSFPPLTAATKDG